MLLIDEIDRADDEFEAFLFELLAESAVNWTTALGVFGEAELTAPAAERTLSTVLKYPEDEQAVRRSGLATLTDP